MSSGKTTSIYWYQNDQYCIQNPISEVTHLFWSCDQMALDAIQSNAKALTTVLSYDTSFTLKTHMKPKSVQFM
jgi:hypothetical protein